MKKFRYLRLRSIGKTTSSIRANVSTSTFAFPYGLSKRRILIASLFFKSIILQKKKLHDEISSLIY